MTKPKKEKALEIFDEIYSVKKSMTTKPKDTKWVNKDFWSEIEDVLFGLHIRFCPFVDTSDSKITQKLCNQVKDELRERIKELLTQTQQDILEWVLNGMKEREHDSECGVHSENCECGADGFNKTLKDLRQTIKKKMEKGGGEVMIRVPTCPKCGCHDIRNLTWSYKCFKCGHVIKNETVEDITQIIKKKMEDLK